MAVVASAEPAAAVVASAEPAAAVVARTEPAATIVADKSASMAGILHFAGLSLMLSCSRSAASQTLQCAHEYLCDPKIVCRAPIMAHCIGGASPIFTCALTCLNVHL